MITFRVHNQLKVQPDKGKVVQRRRRLQLSGCQVADVGHTVCHHMEALHCTQ